VLGAIGLILVVSIAASILVPKKAAEIIKKPKRRK
jgi:hypothetical protein